MTKECIFNHKLLYIGTLRSSNLRLRMIVLNEVMFALLSLVVIAQHSFLNALLNSCQPVAGQ